MLDQLSPDELVALVRRVFAPREGDRRLLVMVDLPDARTPDSPQWRARREMAAGWASTLAAQERALGLAADFAVYPNVGSNNGDLPDSMWLVQPGQLPADAGALASAAGTPLERVLAEHTIVLAPTEFSATAPLKLLARRLGFRAATMGGFSPAMVPALRLDFGEVRRRVALLKDLLDLASEVRITFAVDGGADETFMLDLRHRMAHASDGILDVPGVAGNLPSGEAYIVPYEGEIEGDPSYTAGVLPVQFGGDVLRYHVEGNVARRVDGEGAACAREAAALADEPAYGNIAELGLGVLADLGVQPTGAILLDEKLGLHVAFGRSAGLRLQLSGSDAMALALGPDSSGTRALAEGRAEDIVRAAFSPDQSALERVLLTVEHGWAPELRRVVAAHERAHGPLVDAVVTGTVALPWLNKGQRTYVQLHSKRGDSDLALGWLAGANSSESASRA